MKAVPAILVIVIIISGYFFYRTEKTAEQKMYEASMVQLNFQAFQIELLMNLYREMQSQTALLNYQFMQDLKEPSSQDRKFEVRFKELTRIANQQIQVLEKTMNADSPADKKILWFWLNKNEENKYSKNKMQFEYIKNTLKPWLKTAYEFHQNKIAKF